MWLIVFSGLQNYNYFAVIASADKSILITFESIKIRLCQKFMF